MRKLLLTCLCLPLMLLIAGCADSPTLPNLSNPVLRDLAETGLVVLAMKSIEKSSDPAEKASRIYRIASEIHAAAQAESIRAEVVRRLIDEAVEGRTLEPSDLYLRSRVEPWIASLAGPDGLIAGDKLLALRATADEIITITGFYGAE